MFSKPILWLGLRADLPACDGSGRKYEYVVEFSPMSSGYQDQFSLLYSKGVSVAVSLWLLNHLMPTNLIIKIFTNYNEKKPLYCIYYPSISFTSSVAAPGRSHIRVGWVIPSFLIPMHLWHYKIRVYLQFRAKLILEHTASVKLDFNVSFGLILLFIFVLMNCNLNSGSTTEGRPLNE